MKFYFTTNTDEKYHEIKTDQRPVRNKYLDEKTVLRFKKKKRGLWNSISCKK